MDNHAEIVIKKVKKGGHGGHHGGAWKVAYADFVTAMMAFFLLLWLLNATTEEQKMGISNYFDPTAISRSTRSGSGGLLGGTSITQPGALKSAGSPPMVSTPTVARPQAEETESVEPDSDDPENIESRTGSDEDEEGTITQQQLEQLLQQQEAAREAAQFAEAEQLIRKAIEESEDQELKEAAEGLEIQSAKELSKEEIKKITEDLAKNFSSKMKLNYKHDKSLIGGLIIQVNSTMIDTSIKNKLQKIENRMLEA